MDRPGAVSRRGVYYDLTASPYEWTSPYGDVFKFSSQKKLDIYTRDIEKEWKRVDDLFTRHHMKEIVAPEVVELVKRYVTKSFYKHVER